MSNINLRSAIAKVNKAGALLVFPIKNHRETASLWSVFYPQDKMSWDWSEDGDNRVADLWHLRTRLSTSNEVVYSKWFRNRATVFSFDLFSSLLSLVSNKTLSQLKLSADAISILKVLSDDSPLPSKILKDEAGLIGADNTSRFDKAMKELWLRFLIVGYGEVDEGGYPSLAVGTSKLLFEDLWEASQTVSAAQRRKTLAQSFPVRSAFYTQYLKIEKLLESL